MFGFKVEFRHFPVHYRIISPSVIEDDVSDCGSGIGYGSSKADSGAGIDSPSVIWVDVSN